MHYISSTVTLISFYSFFGFKSNLPFEVEKDTDIEEFLTKSFDGKKIKVDFYRKEDGQNRIMEMSVIA